MAPFSLIAAALALPALASATSTCEGKTVKVTNLTYSQPFTPILAVYHSPDIALFKSGEAPSAALAEMAETGSLAMLADLATGELAPYICGFAAADGITPPGATAELSIPMAYKENCHCDTAVLSVVSMLANTNDAFLGMNSVAQPAYGYSTFRAPAYDAGSEANTQVCEDIPGPACGDGENNAVGNGEGFVHIHRGQVFLGDNDPSDSVSTDAYDWRNPVASIYY
ncbi:unnamed protein product [Chrysoparadoxa australica]